MEDKENIIHFLKTIEFTVGMSDPEIEVLWGSLKVRHFEPQDVILREKELSDDIYVILHGKVKVLVTDIISQKQYRLVELGEKERFGEISFRDGLPRSSTVKALDKTSVIQISKKKLLSHSILGQRVIDRIILNTAVQLSKRIRVMDDTYVEMLKHKIVTLNDRIHFSRLFVMITILLGLSNVLDSILTRYYPAFDVRSFWFSWSYLLLLFVPFVVLVLASPYPASTFGLTAKHAKKSLTESLMIIAVFAPAIVYLCDFSVAGVLKHFLDPMALAYLAHTFIQEFIARGVIQSTISHFLFDRKNIVSIFLASFYFGIFHLHIGFMAFLLTFIFGLLFGYIFYRQKNLLGVTLVHFTLGWIVLGRLV